MENYRKMYLTLFHAITDALDEIERCNYGSAAALLKKAQQDSEDCYIEQS